MGVVELWHIMEGMTCVIEKRCLKNLRATIPFLAGLLFLLACFSTTKNVVAEVDFDKLQPHPRLLMTEKSFAAFKSRLKNDVELARRYQLLKNDAVQLLSEPPAKYEIPDGKRLLSVSRKVVWRIYTLALVYRVESDRRFLNRAWDELNNAARFKDWNPSHFLDTSEMTHAFAIGYDWLFEFWSSDQRKAIRSAIMTHGLTPGLNSYQGKARYGWWVGAVHNWNQVCNGGLLMGALAVADVEPTTAKKIVDAAIRSLPKAMKEYAPTGGYKEGPSYWGYGTTYNVLAIAALESSLGTDFDLSKSRGFNVTGHFPVYMTSPSGYPFNFADCKFKPSTRTAALYWLGHRFDQPLWLWHAERYSKESSNALDLLWRTVPPREFEVEKQQLAMAWPAVEAMTMRGSWTDPNATFVGFKAGHPADNHAQADLGSFVVDALGVRWAVDLGPDNYNLPGYFDRGKRRWYFYRNRAEGHNTLVINPAAGPDQVIKSKATIASIQTQGDKSYALADLTQAYATEAKSVRRGIMLVNGRDVLVQDEIQGKSMDIHWFMHTRGKITLDHDGRTATLTQQGKQFFVQLIEPNDAKLEIKPARQFESSPSVKGQDENEGMSKLAVRIRNVGSTRIAVWLSPANAKPPAIHRLDSWNSEPKND